MSKSRMKNSMESLILHFKLMSEGFILPTGDHYLGVEAPKGEFGVFLGSSNLHNKPTRCKFRSSGFYNLQGLV